MREFFRGWRRKAGLVTLMLALVFMMGWISSFSASIHLNLRPTEFTMLSIASIGGSLAFGGTDGRELKFIPNYHIWSISDFIDIHDERLRKNGKQRFRWLAFEIIDFEEDYYVGEIKPVARVHLRILICPYWSIVVPLTAISTWLLLSKPHTIIQKKIAEPVTAEAT